VLESKFERQLYDSARLGSYDLAEVWRVYVVIRQLEIHIVEDVEELCTELQVHSLVNGNALDGREVPLLECWTIHGVAADVAKLPDLRVLKRVRIEPALRGTGRGAIGTRPSIGIADNVWTAAEESGDFRGTTL